MYRILLVDDEILVRSAIRENIDWPGIGCELVGDCQNGQEAAEFVKRTPVDIVLTDIFMPYMDGMELSHFLHDNYPDIVIVVFSGFGEFEYAKKAIRYNVSEYMLKPVTAMELIEVLDRMKAIVDQRRQEKKRLERLVRASADYRRNAHIIRSKAFEALVTCSRDVKESMERLSELGIVLSASRYRVAVFDMDIYSDMYQLDMEKQQESALMAFVLFNVSAEIAGQDQSGYAYQEGGSRVCVLFQGSHTAELSARALRACREIQQKVRELIGIEVSVGLGDHVCDPSELLLSYRQAEKALQYRYFLGGQILLDMEEVKTDRGISLYDTLEELTDAVKTGKRESMMLAIARMEQEIKEAYLDKSRACMCLQQMIRAIGNAYEAAGLDPQALHQKRDELLSQVTEQKTFQQAIGLVKEYANQAFEELSSMNSTRGQRQAFLALDYIQNNYMDSDLGLDAICRYLGISTSHFSAVFKEATGETFMEVLIRTRMEKAKELLETTDLRNYEIAEKVGFSDPHYFGISFKKMTGKTPTEYARECRK